MVLKALAQCKEEMVKNKTTQTELEKKLSKVNQNRDKGLMMKREISEHALKKTVVWSFLLNLKSKCRNGKTTWKRLPAACVKNVEEMLNRNEMGEILEMKKVVLEQLRYMLYPPHQYVILVGEPD
ncbi:uncharacterized protein LOC114574373 [Exaiptasia diaphana]|uniref:Uncharacterized protein n=1 Tax=Exaiptasia diaphana TaxID=2652724 RepID=A0A913YC73_EXADI|nr:uncharacterized protein LOC114574373 [Exaiptasia diaphana]